MNSSMPKLMSARLVPSSAMHRPGGTYQHHCPDTTAWPCVASNRIDPQLQFTAGFSTPRKPSATYVPIAYNTVNRNDAARMATRFGTISDMMMRQVRSPLIRAASTKSRLRSDSDCARSTRAPHAQPVNAITPPTRRSFAESPFGRKLPTTISSGRAGSTRNTFAIMDSTSSTQPPTYPAVMPMTIDRIVAMAPARNDTTIVGRAPTSSCDQMSWPSCVWPSQWCALGSCVVDTTILPGSYGASHGPMIARITKRPSRTRPTIIFGERGSHATRRLRVTSGASPSTGALARSTTVVTIGSCLLAGARVEEHVDDVGQQIRGEHDERDDEEDALDQRVVLTEYGLVEHIADARIREHDLGQQRTGHDKAQCQREARHGRQDGVAGRVPDDLARRQHLGLGEQHIVLVGDGDHHVSHADDPPGQRRTDDGHARQDRVMQRVSQERAVEADGGVLELVSAVVREPLQVLREEQQQQRGQEEIRHRLEERADRQHTFQPRSTAPRDDGADRRTEHEAHHGGGADEQD